MQSHPKPETLAHCPGCWCQRVCGSLNATSHSGSFHTLSGGNIVMVNGVFTLASTVAVSDNVDLHYAIMLPVAGEVVQSYKTHSLVQEDYSIMLNHNFN